MSILRDYLLLRERSLPNMPIGTVMMMSMIVKELEEVEERTGGRD